MARLKHHGRLGSRTDRDATKEHGRDTLGNDELGVVPISRCKGGDDNCAMEAFVLRCNTCAQGPHHEALPSPFLLSATDE